MLTSEIPSSAGPATPISTGTAVPAKDGNEENEENNLDPWMLVTSRKRQVKSGKAVAHTTSLVQGKDSIPSVSVTPIAKSRGHAWNGASSCKAGVLHDDMSHTRHKSINVSKPINPTLVVLLHEILLSLLGLLSQLIVSLGLLLVLWARTPFNPLTNRPKLFTATSPTPVPISTHFSPAPHSIQATSL